MSVVLVGNKLFHIFLIVLFYQSNGLSTCNSINQGVLLYLEKFEKYKDDDDSSELKHKQQQLKY